MPRYLHIPHTPDTARTLTLSGRNCLVVSGMVTPLKSATGAEKGAEAKCVHKARRSPTAGLLRALSISVRPCAPHRAPCTWECPRCTPHRAPCMWECPRCTPHRAPCPWECPDVPHIAGHAHGKAPDVPHIALPAHGNAPRCTPQRTIF